MCSVFARWNYVNGSLPYLVWDGRQKATCGDCRKALEGALRANGPEYEGEVEESDIIMTLSENCAVGNLFQVKAEEKDAVDRLFSSIGVDP